MQYPIETGSRPANYKSTPVSFSFYAPGVLLSYFDNVMTKLMTNNRTDAWKTDISLLILLPLWSAVPFYRPRPISFLCLPDGPCRSKMGLSISCSRFPKKLSSISKVTQRKSKTAFCDESCRKFASTWLTFGSCFSVHYRVMEHAGSLESTKEA